MRMRSALFGLQTYVVFAWIFLSVSTCLRIENRLWKFALVTVNGPFVGTKKQARIIHGKRVISNRIIESLMYILNFTIQPRFYITYLYNFEARRERSELYGREYDQGKVTYNDIYFQQKSLWPIFSSFFFPEVVTGRCQDWGGLDYTASHKIWVSLINVTKWQETSVSKCHEHILLIIFIINYWFTYNFIY